MSLMSNWSGCGSTTLTRLPERVSTNDSSCIEAILNQLCIALDVVPVVYVVGISIQDTSNLVSNHFQSLFLVIYQISPASGGPHPKLEALGIFGMLSKPAITLATFCEG